MLGQGHRRYQETAASDRPAQLRQAQEAGIPVGEDGTIEREVDLLPVALADVRDVTGEKADVVAIGDVAS